MATTSSTTLQVHLPTVLRNRTVFIECPFERYGSLLAALHKYNCDLERKVAKRPATKPRTRVRISLPTPDELVLETAEQAEHTQSNSAENSADS